MTARLDRAVATSDAIQSRAEAGAPSAALLDLPERAVQFGTGVLLRGLVEAVIDDANRAGAFGGRVVAVGSTGSGRDRAINAQDGLFTLLVQGRENGAEVRSRRLIASLSRALSAADEWDDVLRCARNPSLEVVFSNTTEVGIVLDESDLRNAPAAPISYPGKLTRFLHARATHFAFDREKGVAVLPCELIEANGDTLRDIVETLAREWTLGAEFERWLREAVDFCNTLVDRIVPGTPGGAEFDRLEKELGYRDDLLTVCEPYRLLVIENAARGTRRATLEQRLRFATADAGALVVGSVVPYRERKVRILNGGHTSMVSLALLAGCETVRDAVEHPSVEKFIRQAVLNELVPTIALPETDDYARAVLERFANPFIRHQLRDITLHGGTKMRVRVVPAIAWHAARGTVPGALTLGFAAYLLYAATRGQRGPADDVGATIRARWAGDTSDDALNAFVGAATSDTALWGIDLDALPRFTSSVVEHLTCLVHDGAASALSTTIGESRPDMRQVPV